MKELKDILFKKMSILISNKNVSQPPEYKAKMRLNKKMKINTLISLLIVFSLNISCTNKENKNEFDLKNRSFKFYVNRTIDNHGGLIINNALRYLPMDCPLVSDRPDWIKKKTITINDISPPYEIIKLKNESEFKIIKHQDTLIFTLPPKREKDFYDVTFSEFFKLNSKQKQKVLFHYLNE
jgi:hypothetical protein